MPAPDRRAAVVAWGRRTVVATVAVAACVVAATTVWNPAGSAFSGTSSNAANTWESGLFGGQLRASGLGWYGALGTGSTTSQTTFTLADDGGATDWADVGAGRYHGCGTRTGGELYCWGDNSNGRTGQNTTSGDTLSPARVGTGTDWQAVDAGDVFSCGLRNGGLWCWGDNTYGQTGLGTTSGDTMLPTQSGSVTTWSLLEIGDRHACAMRTNGTIWCWGDNNFGRTGQGTTSGNTITPTQVGSATDWVTMDSGYRHACAIKTNGNLWCWGDNSDGRTGQGTTSGTLDLPAQVGSATDWASVSGGEKHTCAIKTNGTLWCWGQNGDGQLGLGSTTAHSTPQQVGSLTTWATVAASAETSCALRQDSTFWCWGHNDKGEAGVGDTTRRLSPVQISVPGTPTVISAGQFAEHIHIIS